MKKILALCLVASVFSFSANAQTTKTTSKASTKKTVKYKVIQKLKSPQTQAKIEAAKKEMKKEGE